MKLQVPIFLLTLIQCVTPQKYLFETAYISYKSTTKKPIRNEFFKKLSTIDQHFFAPVTNFKVRTTNMRMYEGAVKNLPELKVLRLKDCGIRHLAQNCLQNLPKLEVVHLQDNDLSVIEEGVFNYLPIRELWLHKNEISVIRPGAFDNMPNLAIIKLNNNMLTEWDNRWFANTPKLWKLLFRKNKIRQLPPKAFVNIKTSHKKDGIELVDTKIFLSKNNLSYLHPEALHGIDSLDELDLKRNELQKINWKVFSHMTELHKLNLSRSYVKTVDDNAFENMQEMLELDLSNNLLECVPYKVVAKVKKIDVSKNDNMDCDCWLNLRERLGEERIKNEIVVADTNCEDGDENDDSDDEDRPVRYY